MSEQEELLKRLVELQEKLLAQARHTNQLLLLLIDALSEDDELDDEDQPLTYLDGKPV